MRERKINMNRRNEGISESDILQNQFTAYLQTSLQRCKIQYLDKLNTKTAHEVELSPEQEAVSDDFCISIAEKSVLSSAMQKIRERERIVVTLRAIEGRNFNDIAIQLGMKYSSVTMIYYRALDKLRIILQEDDGRL